MPELCNPARSQPGGRAQQGGSGGLPLAGPSLALALAAVIGLCGTMLGPPSPILVWNASASSAIGLYWVRPAARLRPGDIAIAWPPDRARKLASERAYLPARVPLVKHVAAIAGDRICAAGTRLFVNGQPAPVRRVRDRSGRPMMLWSGCRRLGPGELLLLSPDVPDAFDGRYFGVTRAAEVIGRGSLLWAR